MTDYTVGDTFYINFTTKSSGIPTVLIGTPGVSAIEDNSITPITAGITLTVDIAGVVGLNNLEIVATTGNGFESGKDYTLYIDTGTVGGDSRIGEVAGTFTLGRIADLVWDEPLTGATHNIVTAAGRRLRLMAESGSYENGLVWLDANKGTAGDTPFENGTNVLPVTTVTDANTILAALALHGVTVAAGTSVTFTTPQTNQQWTGEGWTLDFGSQDISGISITNAVISGISTGVSTAFRNCFLNSCTLAGGDFIDCAIAGTITLGTSGIYHFYRSHHAGPATIDFGTGINGATMVHVHGYVGGLRILNMGQIGTDSLFFDSAGGQLTLDSTCVGGAAYISGTFDFIDNSIGTTINNQGAINETIGSPVALDISTDIANINPSILTTALVESYAANGAPPTLTQAIYAIHQMLMQFGIVGTNYSVRRLDDTSSAFTVVLDSSTDPTDAKRV